MTNGELTNRYMTSIGKQKDEHREKGRQLAGHVQVDRCMQRK